MTNRDHEDSRPEHADLAEVGRPGTARRLASAAPIAALFAIAGAYFILQRLSPDPVPAPPIAAVPSRATAPEEPRPAQAAASSDHWSFYHGDSALAGFASAVLPAQLAVRWRYNGEGAFTQPAVSDEHGLYACTTDGILVALDFGGQERWSSPVNPDARERVEAPIATAFGLVLVPCLSGRLYAMDAATGAGRWTLDIGGELLGTAQAFQPADPAQPRLIAVINRTDGQTVWIDPADGAVRWRTAELSRTDSSAALADGILAFGSCDVALHFLPAKEGAARVDIPLGGDCQIASGPAIVDGRVYCGSRCGKLICAELRTGQVHWINESCPDEIFTTPAVGGDIVVFGAEDAQLYALDRATGELRWQRELPDVPSSPVLAGDAVLVSAGGVLHRIQGQSGDLVWSYPVSDRIAGPALMGGLVIVPAGDGAILAFGG
ncbi:MAG: PQQ-binding-like beta-propeller repeat protein [Candidatus Hydrogenedentes bacterium]|nr:PQQ-binding-like beta-propeller repeat protein [Candidatus Hydrogenedentota bacterium]